MEARTALVLTVACLAAAALLPSAAGHGFMYQPAARNVIHNSDYCPHCLSAGGPWEVSAGSTLVWPAGMHGVCGDKAGDLRHEPGGVYGPAGVQATYTAGQVITISLLVTAQHGGRHTFRICDRASADEACLYANVLQRADGTGPYTWVAPSGGPAIPASGYSTGAVNGYNGEIYSMDYKLPDGLTCSDCTLQWEWTSGNSCNVPGSPWGTGMASCDSQGPYPEEFWNCADVAIVGGAGVPQPTTTPTVDPAQPTVPTTPTPTVDPTQPAMPTTPTVDPTQPVQPTTPTVDPTPTYDRFINPGGAAGASDPASACQSAGDGLHAAPWSCAQFLNCGGGTGGAMDCPPGTLWDDSAKTCNFADQVDCGGRPR